ncbi:hypothetical protein JD969_08920 [Planctomycetota bacterium]|nr:hypothetical protein JD969_08920 [Planctomycetota bacterium]
MFNLPYTIALTQFFTFIYLPVIVFIWFFYSYIHRWTRPALFFSVTVRPDFKSSEQGKRFTKQFKKHINLYSIIATLVLLTYFLTPNSTTLMLFQTLGAITIQLLGITIAFVKIRQKVLNFSISQPTTRSASLIPRKTTLATPYLWFGPPLIILIAAAVLAFQWDSIPPVFTTSWDALGNPTQQTHKSISSVFALPLLTLSTFFLMLISALAISRFTKRTIPDGPAAIRQSKFINLTQSLVLISTYALTIIFTALSLFPLSSAADSALPNSFYYIMSFAFIPTIFALYYMIRAGQGCWKYNRLSPSQIESTDAIADGTPDSAWKLGLVYFNPNDSALFVERRFGIGYDMNWARPTAYIFMGIILLASLGISLLCTWMLNS